MRQVKIGIIGNGGMGTDPYKQYCSLKNCYVSAVCDIDAEKIKDLLLKTIYPVLWTATSF